MCGTRATKLNCSVGVVSATVNVLCELVRREPQEFLNLAPQLFHLLTTSSNNWMLIKIIKLVSLTRKDGAPDSDLSILSLVTCRHTNLVS